MLKKGFSTVVAALVVEITAVRAELCGQLGKRTHPPLRIAEPDIRCPRIELRAAGALSGTPQVF
jgi:hypothetical protein